MINYLMKKTQRQSEDLWLKNLDEQKDLKKSFQKEKDILRAQIKNLKKDVQNLNKEMEMEKKRVKELEEINSKMKLEQEKREKEIISAQEKREKEIEEFNFKNNILKLKEKEKEKYQNKEKEESDLSNLSFGRLECHEEFSIKKIPKELKIIPKLKINDIYKNT